MADYQSLLTRAVANLPSTSTAATRQAIYDRARKALLTQLRTLRPPLPESDIEREEKALDRAIAFVEAKFGPPDAVAAETTSAAAHAAAQASAPVPRAAGAPAGARKAASATSPPSPAPAPAPGAPPLAARAWAPTALKDVPREAKPTAAPTRPSQAGAPLLPPGAAGRPAVVTAKATETAAPPLRADRSPQAPESRGGAAPAIAIKGAISAAPANLAKVIPSAQTREEGSGAPNVVASRGENEPGLATAPEVPVEVDRSGSVRADSEGLRPQAPTVAAEKRKSWPWLALAVVLGIVLSVAAAAIVMRQKPQDLAIAPPEPHEEAAPPPPAKIAQRAQPSPADDKAPAPPASEPSGAQPGAQPAVQSPTEQPPANAAAETPSAGQLPSAARAAMLIASADNPQKPIVNLGSTVWSTIPPAPGQPASVAVKADADIPDLKMHATMILRKNTDPTLQATHTIDLKFTFADGAPLAGFKDVGLPQMRKLNSTASEALSSVKVKISDDYFLIALAKSEQDVARNLDLMQTRAWFDFPLLLNDSRIAKLVFQKSADGEAMLDKAFEAWK